MSVLVTGGTGFIGKKLIAELISEAYNVVALARSSTNLPAGVHQVLKCDLSTIGISQIVSFMKENKVDIVVHLAAVMNFYPSDEAYLWNINVEGTRKLAEASIQSGIKRFIYISSTEAIGAHPTVPDAKPLTESEPCHPFFKYGHSKLAAENLIKDLSPKLPYVILRLTGVLGPGDDFAIHELLQSVSYGLFFFSPKNDGKIAFTHIEDVVRGIMCAIRGRKEIIGQTYIICPDNCASYSDIIAEACRGLNRISPVIRLSIPMIRAVTKMAGPMLNVGKTKVFLFKADTIDRMAEDRWYSNKKAKEELGYRPQYTFEEAIQHTLKYMISKGEVCTWYISPVMLIFLFIVICCILFIFIQ